MARHLVINADDLGYSEERDVGIFECFCDNRSITSASVLANGVTAEKALVYAEEIGLPVGLHFNITEGKPISPADTLPTLTENGFFLGRTGFMQRIKLGKVNNCEITKELLSQIQWFESIIGTPPHHVDGHQHVHIMPYVRNEFAQALKQKKIVWTRLPYELCDTKECSDPLQYVLSNCMAAAETFSSHNVLFPKSFVGISVMGRKMSVPRLAEALKTNFKLASDCHTCELMVHPGYRCKREGGCGSGPDDFSMSEDREYEMNLLRGNEWKKHLSDSQYAVSSYKELPIYS